MFGSLVVGLASTPAYAQLPDPEDPAQIADGTTAYASGSIAGQTGSRERALDGDAAAVVAWTRTGIDPTQGFRGPRWTRRWGARAAARLAAGTADRPLELEQRAELALYAGSIGQTFAWQVRPRLTDRLWWTRGRTTLGGFVDFPGLGYVDQTPRGAFGAEAFAAFLSYARGLGADASTTIELELALARVAGREGDLRITNHRATVRDDGATRTVIWDCELFSMRRLELAAGSPWRLTGAIGVSTILPVYDAERALDEMPNSIVPLVRVGIERAGGGQLAARRSEIGRPLVDDADLGAELATLHRLVDAAGVDAGGQLVAWSRHAPTEDVSLRAEGMVGVGERRLVPDAPMPDGTARWREASELIVLARLELALATRLAYGLAAEVRAWIERSDRAAAGGSALAWHHGIEAGLTWRL